MTIGWLDCSAGVSGDMLLGAVVDCGVPLEALQEAVRSIGVEPIALRAERVTRGGLQALRVHVEVTDNAAPRRWVDVQRLLADGPWHEDVRLTALGAFERLARAEASVHGVAVESVHFHEVGALDALADIVGAATGLHLLGLQTLTASPVALGSGSVRSAHGRLPVPVPAVLELLTGRPVRGGAVAHEMTTPTGAALLATVVTGWGELPPMRLTQTGMGAGSRDPDGTPNVLRLVVGEPLSDRGSAWLLETNVDDLDPRLWPTILERLLAAGASDAWLTPILMKKGRPAHTLSVLCHEQDAASMRQLIFTETSTIGLRMSPVTKVALDRYDVTVEVDGQPVRVKLARHNGQILNANPEYEDVVAAADALGRGVKDVLAHAAAAAQTARKKASTPDWPRSGTATTS